MENENTSFTEFAEAFDDSADYQIDSAEETAAGEDITEASDDVQEVDETGTEAEDTESGDDGNQTEESANGDTKAQQEQPGETFTLKVNKEEKTYSREEVINLAQKGADYDRVKGQLQESRQRESDLQGKLDDQQDVMAVLSELAKDSKVEIPELLRNMRIGLLKKQGLSEDAANERLLRMEAEKETAKLKANAEEKQKPETGDQRAAREIAEFRETYPDVALTQEVLDKLMDDVQGGTSLVKAYQKYESAQKDAQIAELQRQLAAEKQNKANLVASPGSQKDSGGKRTKSDFDDFIEAFS